MGIIEYVFEIVLKTSIWVSSRQLWIWKGFHRVSRWLQYFCKTIREHYPFL